VAIPAAAPIPTDLIDAYAYCERIARAHYENFPVASFLLPKPLRPHIAAVYAFARSADDFADEDQRTPEERYRLLEDWRELLWQCADPRNSPRIYSPLFRALGHTIRVCGLQVSLLEDLLSAFRQDVATDRYSTWQDLLDYCRRSANPVGRLVLRIAGYGAASDGHDPQPDDDEIGRRSDAVCTALQLTNFWQDFAIDWRRGRLYLPRETWEARGAREIDLDRETISPAWRDALDYAQSRTRHLFEEGRAVCDMVRGRLRFELRVTWLGGRLVLDRLAEQNYDVFRSRPTIARADVPALAWRAMRWPVRPPDPRRVEGA
jgi:phytoene synthase